MPHAEPLHNGPLTGIITYWIGRIFLWFFGWKAVMPQHPYTHAVVIAYPHTTNWDLPFMLACAWALRMRLSWLGKHTLFEGMFGGFMRWLGGIPVDRRSRNNVVQQVTAQLKSMDKVFLAISPEGTRKYCEFWKTGFYHIAREAGIPILCGYLDYPKKQGGMGPAIFITGDIKADMEKFRAFYSGIEGKIAHFKGPILLKEELESAASASPEA